MNMVFVCTGNTCRSPMAEGFMKKLFSDGRIEGTVTSRGLAVVKGSELSRNSALAAGEYGADISAHVPMMLSEADMSDADYVFAVTLSHKAYIDTLWPQYSHKVHAVSELSGSECIADPYGGDLEVYRVCARQLYDAVQIIFKKIVDADADKI